ncbi:MULTISPECIES: helix-turn-helix domain-containing protein [Arthrobacter]|uniref:Helix-turn-helix domain-containing protein n=2 Tax=Arthrobacter TaxID=1663 RepID=A0ABU9KIX8_9MICC|nr:helix-turn-helix domain-containing protein [Arthrobacter sp. YJM1]MDP5226913.1 helix-turn-helix domain-containing protein [Arthrobacter sp. YJM1]
MTSTTLTGALSQLAREHALLDVKDAAVAIGVTPWWVRRLIADGELRGINVGGHDKAARWRVDPEDLAAFLRTRENRPRDLFHGRRSA